MASGLLNPKKSRETLTHDPKRRPWKPGAQAPRTAVDERDSDDSSERSFTGDGNGLNGYAVFENRVRIALNSCSKLDIRELRRRLTSELDQVRSLAKKLEASSKKDLGFVGGVTQSQFSSNLESAAVRASSAAAAEKKKKKKEPPKPPRENFSGQSLKSCSGLLEKLMKHKFGWVFNAPVDFKALGLLDYRKIVKRPMDLGTVKARLTKGLYSSASDFAEDIRLTFHNAMLYNPEGQDVHSMAEKLLEIFEEKWAAIEPKKRDFGNRGDDDDDDDDDDEKNEAGLERPRLDRSESVTKPVDPNPAGPPGGGFSGRAGPVLKKPKAKEPDKRDMTYEEKQRLSTSLQNLPSEKLDNVVQIIKKRNLGLCQQDDEIEVDIASVEPETLWELDRFVTNYKKGLSKNKRKAELALQSKVVEKNVAHKSSKTDSDSDGSLGSGSAFRS